jgi:hypothetical protein
MTPFRRLPLFFALLGIAVSAFSLGKQREGASVSLDGTWSFAVDTAGTFSVGTLKDRAGWRTITVPGSWQAQCSDLRDFQGVGWYRRTFDPPKSRRGEAMVLTFGAVDYCAEVFVNGVKVGSHEGGYTPFCFEIGDVVHPGANELVVRVMDPVLKGEGTEGIKYQSIPRGKQTWYVQTSGIWQSVRLDVVTPRRIAGLKATADMTGAVDVDLRISHPVDASASNRIEVRILDRAGKIVTKVQTRISARDSLAQAKLNVANPDLWSPESPVLYHIEAVLESNPPMRDRFGFRSIETKAGKLMLNGHPYFLIGALDQDFYPDQVYTTPSEGYLRDEMQKAKRVGLNTLRCHIKAPDPLYLKVADEVGLLVWYEIPNWGVFSPEAGRRGEQTLKAMVERDWNHPSLVILSIINESWGIDMKEAEQRAWLRATFDRMKEYARGRLVVDNSACDRNFHVKSDINDFHSYWALPDRRREFDSVVTSMSTRPSWLVSPYGDNAMTGSEPLMLSEFGTWGLPSVPTPEPWWMSRQFGGTNGMLPQGHIERFTGLKLQDVFGSHREMLGVSQRAQSDALKYQIETLRSTPGIEGYVITEFTDINWECNGVLDMWRNIKECGKVLSTIQQQDVVVARPQRYAWWTDEAPKVDVTCSRYSDESARGVTVYWRTSCKDSGSILLGPVSPGTLSKIPTMMFPKCGDRTGSRLRIDLRMVSAGGKLVATNALDLAVYPREMARDNSAEAGVKVVSALDSTTIATLHQGADVLLLMDSTTVFPSGFPLVAVRRDTGWYDGNWASALYWARTDKPPFQGISKDHRIGFEAAGMRMPFAVRMTDPAGSDDLLSGMFIGWIQRPAGFVAQMKVGKGKIIVSALPLQWTAGDDPYSAVLLRNLKQYLTSSACAPKVEWTTNQQ